MTKAEVQKAFEDFKWDEQKKTFTAMTSKGIIKNLIWEANTIQWLPNGFKAMQFTGAFPPPEKVILYADFIRIEQP